jgi:hypothetical protein
VILDLGNPDFSVWIVEVEAGAGEALVVGALNAQVGALLVVS